MLIREVLPDLRTLKLGILPDSSSKLDRLRRSRVSPPTTSTEIGTFCRDSCFFWAVTMMSSSVLEASACGVVVASWA